MVKKLLGTLMIASIMVSGCSDENRGENLIDKDYLISNSWVNYNGRVSGNDDMKLTVAIPVDANKQYKVTRSTYVSFYDETEFLETILITGGDFPKDVEILPDATHIRLSFNEVNLEHMSFYYE